MAVNQVTASEPDSVTAEYGLWWVKSLTISGGSAPPGSAAGPVTLSATAVKARPNGPYMEESPNEGSRIHLSIPDLLAAGAGNAQIEAWINAGLALLFGLAAEQGKTI
jgi:hypothetical protein